MYVPVHQWAVRLYHAPGKAEMQFLHISRATGTQVLDSQLWPLSPDIRTERGYLQELYAGVLEFQERRA